MVFLVGLSGVSWGQVLVLTDKTWDNTTSPPNPTTVPGAYSNGIVIYPNVNLTIKNVSLSLNPFSVIELQTGATLTLESGASPTTVRLGVGGQLTTNSNSVINLTETTTSVTLTIGSSGLISVKGNSDLNVSGASLTLNSNAQLVLEEGNVTSTSSNIELLDNTSFFIKDNSNWTSDNSIYTFGQDAEVLAEKYYIDLQFTGTTFQSTSNTTTWKGIKLKTHGPPHSIAAVHWNTPASADANGGCDEIEWAGVVSDITPIIKATNCTFKNAEHAVYSATNIYKDNGGSIVRLNNCQFINCKNGVNLEAYEKATDVTANWIMTCDFNWNDDVPFALDELKHIEMWRMGPVRIGGCNFYNDITGQQTLANRGVGINVLHSDLALSKDGDRCCSEQNECPDNCFANPSQSRRNTFANLGYGIRAIGGKETVNSTPYPSHPHFPSTRRTDISIRYSDFDNCIHSIYAEKCLDAQIGYNTFDIVKNDVDAKYPAGYSTNSSIKQIWFKNSSGLRIYENIFEHDLQYITGILMEDPNISQTSFIRKNTFTTDDPVLPTCGPQMRAIELYGDNDHLDITCNTFVNQVYDVYVHDYASLNDIPNLDVYDGGSKYKFNKNKWSNVPVNTAAAPPLGKWQTLGCSSNVFLSDQASSISVYERFNSLGFSNIRFEVNSYPKTNDPLQDHPNYTMGDYLIGLCPDNFDVTGDCVDCSTDCDKLGIKQTGLSSVDSRNKETKFELYPNPARNEATIKIASSYYSKNNEIIILSLNGEIVLSSKDVLPIQTINLEEQKLVSGVYFVQVICNGYTATSKLIIQ